MQCASGRCFIAGLAGQSCLLVGAEAKYLRPVNASCLQVLTSLPRLAAGRRLLAARVLLPPLPSLPPPRTRALLLAQRQCKWRRTWSRCPRTCH